MAMSVQNDQHNVILRCISDALRKVNDQEIKQAINLIASARLVSVYGCGREGLQIRGFAMRLFHLGRSASVVGEMVTPAVGPGDLLIVAAGPGDLSTAFALLEVARGAGAKVLCITAQPNGRVPRASDAVLTIPAQTMADDRGPDVAPLPMGSVFEGALFVLFEAMILNLKAKLQVSDEAMRTNHTNLE